MLSDTRRERYPRYVSRLEKVLRLLESTSPGSRSDDRRSEGDGGGLMWLIPWSGRRDDARWDEIGRRREEREEKIKDFCSDDRRSDRFAGWCGRLARTGHARGISTGLREFRRSFAQEFHLGRNALGEYRERPVIARHS